MSNAMNHQAWIATAPKEPMVLENIDLGPLGAEDVEVAVERRSRRSRSLPVFESVPRYSPPVA